MSDTLGATTFEAVRPALYLPDAMPPPRAQYSERTAETIDQEVQKLLSAAGERVRETLAARCEDLEALAQELLHHEVVDRAALNSILGAAPVATRTPGKGLLNVESAA
jgi:cell division protease FtsH